MVERHDHHVGFAGNAPEVGRGAGGRSVEGVGEARLPRQRTGGRELVEAGVVAGQRRIHLLILHRARADHVDRAVAAHERSRNDGKSWRDPQRPLARAVRLQRDELPFFVAEIDGAVRRDRGARAGGEGADARDRARRRGRHGVDVGKAAVGTVGMRPFPGGRAGRGDRTQECRREDAAA
ncbi:MAG: hypothetical protein C0484_06800 [Rhodospirillum sp.]|nr:hypothetical protein [Rhodospirillum sp.]